MALITKTQQQQNSTTPIPNQLNAKELEYILILIKRYMHSCEDLEMIYSTIIKLQEQYKDIAKK